MASENKRPAWAVAADSTEPVFLDERVRAGFIADEGRGLHLVAYLLYLVLRGLGSIYKVLRETQQDARQHQRQLLALAAPAAPAATRPAAPAAPAAPPRQPVKEQEEEEDVGDETTDSGGDPAYGLSDDDLQDPDVRAAYELLRRRNAERKEP